MMQTVRIGELEYLTADNIAVPHGFTTRLGGVSRGYLASLNLGMNRGDDPENVAQNYRILTEAIGCTVDDLVLTHQTHSDIILPATQDEAGKSLDHRLWPECDARITNVPGVALVAFTADCTPVLLHDPVTGAVAAIHAGWRGTAQNIVGKTVKAMADTYGCKPENIRAAIGPNIAQCCFETDADVPQAMLETYGNPAEAHIRTAGEKFYVNLKEINTLALRQTGVTDIQISPLCTVCQSHRFWSHRVHGNDRGSQGAIILCKGVMP